MAWYFVSILELATKVLILNSSGYRGTVYFVKTFLFSFLKICVSFAF